MSVPLKYRELADFHEYYSGQRIAPCLTIFIGGNHESAAHLFELYYGGWVAPNIYYMGAANILRLGPLRIAGMSGIWKGHDYRKPHYERLPLTESDIKSFYHVREIDVRKLLQVKTQVDIGMSHDWPNGMEWKGDSQDLFKKKQHFVEDANSSQLGSMAALYVMNRLRPPYWFSAHLHVKYAATVKHGDATSALPYNPALLRKTSGPVAPSKNHDEIDLDLDDEAAATGNKNTADVTSEKTTRGDV